MKFVKLKMRKVLENDKILSTKSKELNNCESILQVEEIYKNCKKLWKVKIGENCKTFLCLCKKTTTKFRKFLKFTLVHLKCIWSRWRKSPC